MTYRSSTTQGFTLVETLVAITIITLAMVGPLYAVERSLTASYIGRDQLTASALAQEGVEYVRGIRDGNYLYNLRTSSTRDWLYGMNGNGLPDCFASDGCTVDDTPTGAGITSCLNGSCAPLKLSNTQSRNPYFYNQQTASGANKATAFTRKIQLTSLIAGTEVKVVVTVTFVNHGKTYTITVQDILENWL